MGPSPSKINKRAARLRVTTARRGCKGEVLKTPYILETPQQRVERADKMKSWFAVLLNHGDTERCLTCNATCRDVAFRLSHTPALIICSDCIWNSTRPNSQTREFMDDAIQASFEDTRRLCYGKWATLSRRPSVPAK